MYELGADLKIGVGNEFPLSVCLRWHYTPLVEFFLEKHIYSENEIEKIFEEVKDPRKLALVRKYYKDVKLKKPVKKPWFFELF